jgi:hypothetical protein
LYPGLPAPGHTEPEFVKAQGCTSGSPKLIKAQDCGVSLKSTLIKAVVLQKYVEILKKFVNEVLTTHDTGVPPPQI